MKTFSVHVLHRKDPITVVADQAVWNDGLVDFYANDECVAEFQRSNVTGVVVVSDDGDKGELQ